jgi:hypothetical protein
MKTILLFILCICMPSLVVMGQLNTHVSVCDSIQVHSNNEYEYDVTLYDYDPSSNFSTDPNFIAEKWTIGGAPITLRALFKLPLPVLPIGSVIDSAVLYLSYNNTTTHLQGNSFYPGSPYINPNDGSISRVIQSWDPLTVTWNNQPATTSFNSTWIPPSSTQSQDLTVNITSLINDSYLYPNNSFGFLFKMNTESTYRCQVYASSNHPNPALHPKLVICYTTTSSNATNDIAKEADVKIDCIPQGGIRISNPSNSMLNEVCIYDLDGSLIERIRLNNREEQKTVQVTRALANGLYVVRLQTEKGSVCSKMPVW